MPPVEFEPTISAGEWLKTYALDRVATGTGKIVYIGFQNQKYFLNAFISIVFIAFSLHC